MRKMDSRMIVMLVVVAAVALVVEQHATTGRKVLFTLFFRKNEKRKKENYRKFLGTERKETTNKIVTRVNSASQRLRDHTMSK